MQVCYTHIKDLSHQIDPDRKAKKNDLRLTLQTRQRGLGLISTTT